MTKTLKTAGGLTVIPALGLLGGPVLAALVCTVVIGIGALCWVVADRRRSSHLAMLIHSLREPRR